MAFCGSCCRWILVLIVLFLVVGGIGYAIKKKINKSNESDPQYVPDTDPSQSPPSPPSPGPDDSPSPSPDPAPGPDQPAVEIEKKYADALRLALQFFDVQKSGKLVGNKIPWRGDSAVDDGSDANLDLSKGMYDAGDNMKFGFPMAFTATVLSWAILENGDHMNAVKQLKPTKDSLRWITDYLINAHVSENELCIQVGDPEVDHKCWQRPETMTEKRPVTIITTDSPGSDIAAETSAALASASIVFRKTDSKYSETLLGHAKELFGYADKFRGFYSESVPEVQSYYNSTGYKDELLWAASWLYHATNDELYLEYVDENGDDFGAFGNPEYFSWDKKLPGAQVLLSRLAFLGTKKESSGNDVLTKYKQAAEAVMCILLPDSPNAAPTRTDGGLLWVSEWDALQQPVASAFLAAVYSGYLASQTEALNCDGQSYDPSDLKNFSQSQADYVLGDNPMSLSYMVGYGKKFPRYVHHRGASILADDTATGCTDGFKWLESKEPNPNVAVGALVGGPFLNESYIDDRNNSMQGEPTTYNSALLVGLLSSLLTSSSSSSSVVSFT